MLVRNMQAMRNDRGRLAAGHRFHELSKPLEDGDNLWADANAWSRRLAHHINRRVVREQLRAVVRPEEDFTFDNTGSLAEEKAPFTTDKSQVTWRRKDRDWTDVPVAVYGPPAPPSHPQPKPKSVKMVRFLLHHNYYPGRQNRWASV